MDELEDIFSDTVCRICLSVSATTDIINDLTVNKGEKSYNIFSFCLDIQITEDPKMHKLCKDCHIKLSSYHCFKNLALKNDAYLRNVKFDTLFANVMKGDTGVIFNGEDNTDEVKEEIIETEFPDEYEVEYLDFKYLEDEIKCVNENVGVEETLTGKPEQIDLKIEIQEEEHNRQTQVDIKTNAKLCTEIRKVQRKSARKSRNTTFKVNARRETCPKQMCEECGKKVSNLERHMEIHNKEKGPFQCKICFKTVVNLKRHTNRIHRKEQLPFECDVCGRRFLFKNLIEDHIATCHEMMRFECDVCHAKYASKSKMRDHRWTAHDIPNEHKVVKLSKHLEKCEDCGQNVKDMELHIKRKHLGIFPQCDICHKAAKNMKRHKATVHFKDTLQYTCDICGKKCYYRHHLRDHIRTIHSGKVSCDVCSKEFNSLKTLMNHKRLIHLRGKQFTCDVCSKSFYSIGQLKAHLRFHTGERPFKCEVCGSTWRHMKDLKTHMAVHTGIKKYCCKICGKTDNDSSNHRKHMKIHEKHKTPEKKPQKLGKKQKLGKVQDSYEVPLSQLKIYRTTAPFEG